VPPPLLELRGTEGTSSRGVENGLPLQLGDISYSMALANARSQRADLMPGMAHVGRFGYPPEAMRPRKGGEII